MNRQIKLSLLFATIITLQNCRTIKIHCKDGETVIVQKNPEKEYKQTAKSIDASLKATIDVIESVKVADLDAGLKTKVIELRDKLDQFSGRTQDILKTSYYTLQTSPCDKDIRNKHLDLLNTIATENFALEKLKLELTRNSDQSINDKVKSAIENYYLLNGEKMFNLYTINNKISDKAEANKGSSTEEPKQRDSIYPCGDNVKTGSICFINRTNLKILVKLKPRNWDPDCTQLSSIIMEVNETKCFYSLNPCIMFYEVHKQMGNFDDKFPFTNGEVEVKKCQATNIQVKL